MSRETRKYLPDRFKWALLSAAFGLTGLLIFAFLKSTNSDDPAESSSDSPALPYSNGNPSGSEVSRTVEVEREVAEIPLDAGPEQQLRAIRSLARQGTVSAINQIAVFIADQPEGDFRERVVDIGSNIPGLEAVSTALDLLQTSSDPGVIRMAQEIFIRRADAAAMQEILDIYDKSSDAVLRDRLERTVACIQTEEAIPILKQVVAPIDSPATDGMVLASAQAMSQIGTPEAVDILFTRLDGEKQGKSRYLIASTIDEVRNPKAEARFQAVASGANKLPYEVQTRVIAISGLLHFPSAETKELLADLKTDENELIASVADETLTEINRRQEE